MSRSIQRALNTRIAHCVILHPASSPHPLGQATPPTSTLVEIGLIFNPSEASRLVDHGPPAGDEAAGAAFREFWGSKAELRRFKDGSIEESVVWEVPNPDERIRVPVSVVQHILNLHFGIPNAQIKSFQCGFDDLLKPEKQLATMAGGGAMFRQATAAFEELVKAVKNVEDMPLSLSHVAPTSEYLRYTSVCLPTPLDATRFPTLPDSAKYVPAMDLTFSFEGSSRWPDDLAAIQKVKMAFFEQIARALMQKGAVARGSVVLDSEAGVIEDNCSLELLTTTGYAFRVRIHHDGEKTLLEKFIAPKQKHWSVPTAYEVTKAQARAALVLHKRRFVHGPRHHNAVLAMHQRSSSYGITTRLVKRWLAAHMLAPFIPVEVVELICAHVYLSPGPFDAPATGPTGFARVIRLLKDWEYRETPLYVPMYAAAGAEPGANVMFPVDVRGQADALFQERVGEVGWTVVTDQDPSGVAFGSVLGPKGSIAGRIRQVAAATWECLDVGMTEGTLDVMVS